MAEREPPKVLKSQVLHRSHSPVSIPDFVAVLPGKLWWFALRHPHRPVWLLPAVLVLGFYALEPFNFLVPLIGVVDDFNRPAAAAARPRDFFATGYPRRLPSGQLRRPVRRTCARSRRYRTVR